MGIADRDWYRDELKRRTGRSETDFRGFDGRRPFERQSSSASRVMTNLVIVLIIFILGVRANDWWQSREHRRAKPTDSITRVDLSDRTDRSLNLPTVQDPLMRAAVIGAPPPRELFKCIVNGRVIYSGPADCRGAMATIPLVAEPSEAPVGGLSEYQREMLRSADARIARDRAAARTRVTLQRQDSSDRQAECLALDQQIRSIDSMSRQPLSGSQQDALRRDRSQATSRQYALRC